MAVLPDQQKGRHCPHGVDAARLIIGESAFSERPDLVDAEFQYLFGKKKIPKVCGARGSVYDIEVLI